VFENAFDDPGIVVLLLIVRERLPSKSKSSYDDEYKNSIDLFTNHDFPQALYATSSVVF